MRFRLTAVETYVLGQTLVAVAGAMAILSSAEKKLVYQYDS